MDAHCIDATALILLHVDPTALQGYLNNEQVGMIVTFISNNYLRNPRMCNSICLASPNVASKGKCAAARANAKEAQMMSKILHYNKVVPIHRSWMATAQVSTRACNTCSSKDNVRRGDFYCQVCKPHTSCFDENMKMMKTA